MTTKGKFELVEQFITENRESHYRLAYSYVRNKENALDIVQEAILKALRSIGKLDNLEYLKTWFYRILINTAIDFIRKNSRMTILDDETLHSRLPGSVDLREDMDLRDAVNQLPAQERTLIILRFYEDLKIEEIAMILDENVNTVKSRMYRVLSKLRMTIGEDDEYGKI